MPEPTIQCGNRDCRVSDTGKCVEGLPIESCPNYGRALTAEFEQQGGAAAHVAVVLRSAQKLPITDAEAILRKYNSRVVAIVGPYDAGKTSLVAGLYDLFQSGPIRSVKFNGSATLHALERACHDARAASERTVPDSERTPLGEVQFYHLGMVYGTDDTRAALLLGDRAGEEYRSAANDAEVAKSFAEVRRADAITFLVDGERLASDVSRHQVRAELLRQVQGLVDGGATNARQRIAVVLTKLDAVLSSDNKTRALADFEADVAKVQRHFAARFSAVRSFQIAASPKTNAAERGAGIFDLLAFWLEVPTELQLPVEPVEREARVFRRLAVRYE